MKVNHYSVSNLYSYLNIFLVCLYIYGLVTYFGIFSCLVLHLIQINNTAMSSISKSTNEWLHIVSKIINFISFNVYILYINK